MALAPGEVFQHTHATASVTILREGSVDLEMNGTRAPLVPNEVTQVGEFVQHTMVNVGTVVARVECMHFAGPTIVAGPTV